MDIHLDCLQSFEWFNYLGFALMFILGIFVSNFPISYITNVLYLLQSNSFYPDNTEPFNYWWRFSRNQSSILGVIERALFITALLINVPRFIAFWYTIKMVSLWDRWSKKGGRDLFNNFLIGNGLSLLFSFSAFMIFKSSLIENIRNRYIFMGIFSVSPFFFALILKLWIKSFFKKYRDKKNVIFRKCYDRIFMQNTITQKKDDDKN